MWEIYLGHVDAGGFGKDQSSFPTDLVFLIFRESIRATALFLHALFFPVFFRLNRPICMDELLWIGTINFHSTC